MSKTPRESRARVHILFENSEKFYYCQIRKTGRTKDTPELKDATCIGCVARYKINEKCKVIKLTTPMPAT